jgi:glutathione peroxidase
MSKLYDFEVKSIDGKPVKLDQYRGQVLLIVNVASKCGFTVQYEGLNNLYREFAPKGFSVLGFPCNQFGAQEPGDENEIKSFCDINFKIQFPMFSKIDVNGDKEHPLYTWLKTEAPGFLGTKSIKWNFTKFLIDAKGNVVSRFAPTDKPEDLARSIAKLLS